MWSTSPDDSGWFLRCGNQLTPDEVKVPAACALRRKLVQRKFSLLPTAYRAFTKRPNSLWPKLFSRAEHKPLIATARSHDGNPFDLKSVHSESLVLPDSIPSDNFGVLDYRPQIPPPIA